MKRWVLVGISVTGALGLAVGLALWAFLAGWVPTNGKALLIQQLEQRWPLAVSLGSIRYRPLQDFVLDDVVVLDRASRTPWLRTPRLTVHIAWWPLVFRQVVFRAEAPLEAPGQTQLAVRGRYRLPERHLRCRLRAPDIALHTLAPSLREHLPPQLLEGTFHVDAGLIWHPEAPVQIAGRMTGARLVWADPPLRVLADLALEGTATAPAHAASAWTFDVATTLHHGTVAGIPQLETLTDLEGTGRLTPERFEIQQLRGTFRESPWRLEGRLEPLTRPALEALISARLELGTVSDLLALPTGWTLRGPADVSAVCRGPLQPEPRLDCLVRTMLEGVALTNAGAANPIQEITGRLDYDRLAQRLVVDALLRVAEHPLTLTATLTDLRTVPRLEATATFQEGRATFTGRWEPSRLVVEAGEVTVRDSRLGVSGEVSRAARQRSDLTLEGRIEPADLAHLPLVEWKTLDPTSVKGPIDVSLHFQGDLGDWRAADLTGRLHADAVRILDIPLERFWVEVSQANRTLQLRVPQARVADGALRSDAGIRHDRDGTKVYWQVDLTDVQLAQLASAIPYWRNRAITGSASASAKLAGTLEQRATWIGEGWLKASGSQLGDLPLLDKLLQRLFGALGDRIGLDALRRAQITDVALQWQMLEERIGTNNLRLGGLMAQTEPIAIYAMGSAGFDQTLDFVIEPEFSETTMLEAPTTSAFARSVLRAAKQFERLRQLIGRHRLTGTIREPEFRFELTIQETLKQLAPTPANLLEQIFKSLR